MKGSTSLIIVLIILIAGFGIWALNAKKDPNATDDTMIEMNDDVTTGNDTTSSNDDTTMSNGDLSQYVTHKATLETSAGTVELDLYGGLVPNAVNNFVKLAQEGYYDDTRFHRIISGFMIQGGDPNTRGGANRDADIYQGDEGAWGTGGPGYSFETEFTPLLGNSVGTIAMANSGGTNTNGSQFFINVNNNSNLNTYDMRTGEQKKCETRGVSCHTAFGKVSTGYDIVEALSEVATSRDQSTKDRPLEDVVLTRVTITPVQ